MNREWRKKERDKKEKYIYTFRTFRFNGVQPPGNILSSHDEFLLVVYFTRDATSATSASIFNWLLTLFKYTRWRVCRGATYGNTRCNTEYFAVRMITRNPCHRGCNADLLPSNTLRLNETIQLPATSSVSFPLNTN